MTSSPLHKAITLFACILIPGALISQTGSRNVDKQRLIEIEHLLNEADAVHDANQASKYLDVAYRTKSVENGLIYDKPATLQEIRREAETMHKDAAPILDGLETAVHGKSARVTFNYIVGTDKETRRFHMVDTFVKRADGWKLVGRTGTHY